MAGNFSAAQRYRLARAALGFNGRGSQVLRPARMIFSENRVPLGGIMR
jgi:hypothetical protein